MLTSHQPSQLYILGYVVIIIASYVYPLVLINKLNHDGETYITDGKHGSLVICVGKHASL